MGSYADPNGIIDANLQLFLLGKIKQAPPLSLVSVNAVIDDIRQSIPSCQLSDQQLARLVKETSALLGHLSVCDPARLENDHYDTDGNYYVQHRHRSATDSARSDRH